MPPAELFDCGLIWLRRDLRIEDNAMLLHALRHCRRVHCVYVFDSAMLEPLPRADRRVEFIRESLVELDAQLRALAHAAGAQDAEAAGLIVLHGLPQQMLPALAVQLSAQVVYAGQDYEPDTILRDNQVRGALAAAGVSWRSGKSHVLFGPDEVLAPSGAPFTQFEPYCAQWLAQLATHPLESLDSTPYATALAPRPPTLRLPVPTLQALGFHATNLAQLAIHPGASGAQQQWQDFVPRMARYHLARDFPAVRGPSYLGVHLRFGTIGLHALVRTGWQRHLAGDPGATQWLTALARREFFIQWLAHYPHVVQHGFHPERERLRWDHGPHGKKLFAAWQQGRTGFPLVDAAMRQLHATGYMHHRLRTLVAGFLTQQLGVDWRWGERHFAEQLNDYELASNIGNWQLAAGVGSEQQLRLRLFNPAVQGLQVDPHGKFIRRYLPELASLPDEYIHAPEHAAPLDLEAAGVHLGIDYPQPLVDLAEARQRALQRHAALRLRRPR